MMRQSFRQVIDQLELLSKLRNFDPTVIGTPPLGIGLAESDIDVACYCAELEEFKAFATAEFSGYSKFRIQDTVFQNQESVIVQFHALEWDFELFCQSTPTYQQWGVRHFKTEQRIFEIAPQLKAIVIKLKRSGLKTEPAIAKVLGLPGDPYAAILQLENVGDDQLKLMISDRHHL